MRYFHKYGLMHKRTNTLLGVDEDWCDKYGMSYTLDRYSKKLWMVDDLLTASYVRKYSSQRYNAEYMTPINPYKEKDLYVVMIKVDASIVKPCDIPSFDEYMTMRYNTEGRSSYSPDHYKVVMDEIKRRGETNPKYSLYELIDLIRYVGVEDV